MNLIETIYCSQYYELKKAGKDPEKGRVSGTLLSATILLLIMVSFFVLLNKLLPGNFFSNVFRNIFGGWVSGRAVGKLLGLIGLAVVGGFLHLTFGSKTKYEQMIIGWEQMPEEVLQQTVKAALKIFGYVFGGFLLIMFICFI